MSHSYRRKLKLHSIICPVVRSVLFSHFSLLVSYPAVLQVGFVSPDLHWVDSVPEYGFAGYSGRE